MDVELKLTSLPTVFQAVCLMEGPISTSLTGPRASEVSQRADKNDEKKYHTKTVPEEGMCAVSLTSTHCQSQTLIKLK